MMGKLNNLQLMRALAVLVAVNYHTNYLVLGKYQIGGFGVDIFFVISGYVMSMICESNTKFFLRRRLIRIIPTYWIATLLLFVISKFFKQWAEVSGYNIWDLLMSLFFIPFSKSGHTMLTPLLPVGWSLDYEMFFYLLIALALLFTKKYALWITAAVITILSFAFLPWEVPHSTMHVFNGNLISMEFVLGILLFYACKKISAEWSTKLRYWLIPIAALSFAAMFYTECVVLIWEYPYRALVFGGGSFIMIGCGVLLFKAGWDISSRTLILLGDASYILYLIHLYIIHIINKLASVAHLPHFTESLFGNLFAIVVSSAIAMLMHLKLERPLVSFLNNRFGGHRASVEFAPEPKAV
jgi:exopolysaccharide production protein ExoZ